MAAQRSGLTQALGMHQTLPQRNEALSQIAMERITEQIAVLEKIDRVTTPFNEIRNLINRLFQGYSCLTRKIECRRAWRARKNIDRKLFTHLREVWYPQPDDVKSFGRLNEPNNPMFYISASHQTSL